MTNINLFRGIQSKFETLEKERLILKNKPTCNLIGEDGNIITPDELSYLGNGANAYVWKYVLNDECYAVKTFLATHHDWALSYDSYEIMRELDLNRIIRPIEGYSQEFGKKSISDRHLDAYLMDFLDEDKKALLFDMPYDKLLENIEELQEDVELLANNHIVMKDIKFANSLFTKTDLGLYIIDVDMFLCDRTLTTNEILDRNSKMLVFLIKSHLLDNIKNSLEINDEDTAFYKTFLHSYFSIDEGSHDTALSKFEGIFSGYDRPKKYFLKRH